MPAGPHATAAARKRRGQRSHPRPGIADGTQVVRHDYAGCAAGGALQHLEVVGNGHFWPDGLAYAPSALLGGTLSRQLDTGRAIVDFLARARPALSPILANLGR